jgi:D-xylose transport system substrate-binding protein
MKIIFQFLLFIVVLLLAGCGSQSQWKVGYLNPDVDLARFVAEGDYMAERFEQLGVEMITLSADDDDAIQLQQGYELLDEGVDVLIIAAINGNTIAPLIRDAVSQGVLVVAYNRLINNADFDLFVTGNNKANAQLFCDAALSRKPTGNYIVFGGDRFDRNGLELKQYIDSILKPHIESGSINLLFDTFVESWSGERAGFEIQKIIDSYGLDIDAVISCNDPMGVAVANVLNKYGRQGEVVITGQDANIDAVRAVYNGSMTMTIYHPHKILGYKTAELVFDLLNGKKAGDLANASTYNGLIDVPTYQINSVAVTKENLDEVLIQSGEYMLDEIAN